MVIFIKIKDMPLSERPRERLINMGKEQLSNQELLAIIIKTGSKGKSVKDLALDVLKIYELTDTEDINIALLTKIKGIGKVKASEILACFELGRRKLEHISKKDKLITPLDVYEYSTRYLRSDKQECFYGIYLNSKCEVIASKLLFVGTINQSIVHPREIFKHAYLYSAVSIICVHNHPSGNSEPSVSDAHLTKNLFEIGEVQGIKIIDHVIIGKGNYYSFNEEKKIFLED